MSERQRYYRKVIKITAWDSPNVRLGLAQRAAGLPDTGLMQDGSPATPGVLPYDDFLYRLHNWDDVKQCVSLRAEFYEGAEVLMFPPHWLDRSHGEWDNLRLSVTHHRKAKGIGVDPAEGNNSTTMCAADEFGVIELVSKKTYDYRTIRDDLIAFMTKHDVPADRVFIDRGGGKAVQDFLKEKGHRIRSVGFGEAPTLDRRHGVTPNSERDDMDVSRYAYVNRRAEMYGELRLRMDPSINPVPFALPGPGRGPQYAALRKQLAVLPLLLDENGRLYMLPKRRKDKARGQKDSPAASKAGPKSLEELIGCSPDEADALVLAYHAVASKGTRRRARALGVS